MNETKKNPIVDLAIGSVLAVCGLALVITAFILNLGHGESVAWFIYVMFFFGASLLMVSVAEIYFYLQCRFEIKKMNVKQMCVIGVFSALSVILYYFAKFNIPLFPSWLDIQFSDLPALLVSFMYGPVSGVVVVFVRFFCKLPGTMTAGVGEFADVLIGTTLCLIAGFIYKKHRSIKGALCGAGIGMLSATVVACVANWLILIPAYVSIAHFPMPALVGIMNKIKMFNGKVTEENFMVYYIFLSVLPFNLFRYTMVFALTFALYKRLHMIIESITVPKLKETEAEVINE